MAGRQNRGRDRTRGAVGLSGEVRRLVVDLVDPEVPDQHLERLRAIRKVRAELDRLEGEAMRSHLSGDGQFREIGTALGITGQAAGWRYRNHHQLEDPREGSRPAQRGPYGPRARAPEESEQTEQA